MITRKKEAPLDNSRGASTQNQAYNKQKSSANFRPSEEKALKRMIEIMAERRCFTCGDSLDKNGSGDRMYCPRCNVSLINAYPTIHFLIENVIDLKKRVQELELDRNTEGPASYYG